MDATEHLLYKRSTSNAAPMPMTNPHMSAFPAQHSLGLLPPLQKNHHEHIHSRMGERVWGDGGPLQVAACAHNMPELFHRTQSQAGRGRPTDLSLQVAAALPYQAIHANH